MTTPRLEELRTELRAERISYVELAELQGLASEIDPDDVELLEAAGVPEFADDAEEKEASEKMHDYWVDGHFIAATNEGAASGECERLYGHTPERVRPWTAEDQITLDAIERAQNA